MPKAHRIESLIARHPEEWGPTKYLATSFDNRSFFCERGLEYGHEHRIILNDRVYAEWSDPHSYPKAVLSYDGKKLAVAMENISGGKRTNVITINGKIAYEVPFETVYRFNWLDNERLAWNAWNTGTNTHRIDDSGTRFFINGVDMTETFDFEPVIGRHGRGEVYVKEENMLYRVYDDGTRSKPTAVPADWSGWHSRGWDWDKDSLPEKAKDSPEIVERLTLPAGFLNSILECIFDRAEAYEARNNNKEPWWMRPIAFIFNPYFGIGHAYLKSAKRYFPANNGKEWKRGYHFAGDQFYTLSGELVASVANGQKMAVAIDEKEGDWWDEVYNSRFLSQENCLSYLAREGNEFFRIVVE